MNLSKLPNNELHEIANSEIDLRHKYIVAREMQKRLRRSKSYWNASDLWKGEL